MYHDIKTLVELIYRSQKYFGDKSFLKHKVNGVFQSIDYNQFVDMMESLSASFYDIGIRKGDKVGIISDNSHKWLITDMALLCLGAVDVPRGSDATVQEITYILKHSDSKYCVVENVEQADKILSITDEISGIKNIILLFGNIADIKNENKNKVSIYLFDELMEKGKELKIKHKNELKLLRDSITETDLVTLIYTSGTTGRPKGVMLIHKNIMHNVHVYSDVLLIREGKERWITVLPVWHVFERTIEYIIMSIGALMAYSKPTAKYLLPDLAEIKPTIMASVPRIWESLYKGILFNIKKDSKFRQNLFSFFVEVGTIYSKSIKVFTGKIPLFRHQFFLTFILKKMISLLIMILFFVPDLLGDILIFRKIRKKIGGCLKQPISGGGALAEHVDTFFSSVKINILEGYGLTETSPIISVRNHKTLVPKTVGRPAPGVQIMIGDEEWNKKANQHRKGVIYIKGDLVMQGYYKEPKKTKEVLKDGWLNTGDLGRLTITGEIQITGRAKDTIVLTGGENIEPAPIEEKLIEEPLINQVMVVGQDKKNLGALIIPTRENLEEFAKMHNIKYENYEDLMKNSRVIEEFNKIIKHRISSWNGFKNFEKITCFALLSNPFEVGEELTNTIKMKRNYIAKKYNEIIEGMYKTGS